MTLLSRAVVPVSRLDRSLPFYESVLGLRSTWASPPIVRLVDASGTEILLHERPASGGEASVALSFTVDDVDAATAASVAAGAELVDQPEDQPWGERQSVLRDPDGHLVCLVRPL
jgi:catechol 2,3-dioxygenase-like lactoylglutathione lyase family enzyme